MPDPYEGVNKPDPERAKLIRSVFNPSPLEEVAEAVSVATEVCRSIYVERLGDQWRWSLATRGGGPYPQQRLTAQYLKMDHGSLRGVGTREVGDGWCCQVVDEETEPDGSIVLTFEGAATVQQVVERLTRESH